jgi:peptidoglycan/xylan/chitin deacetylase (PgdA/CDA1 family)
MKGPILRGAFLAAEVLDRLGLPRALMAARRRQIWKTGGLTVAVYHRVAEPAGDELDPELIDATPSEFDSQMAYVSRNFHSVGIDDVLLARREGRPLPPDSVLITFDDGYLDNHNHAFPILQRHGIRATFFITTGYLTDRRLFWWERVHKFVQGSTVREAHLEYPAPETLDLASPQAKARTKRRLTRIIKDHDALDLERFLDGVSKAFGVSWTEDDSRRHGDRALMSWEHVRAMRAAGMGIGSHTCSHRVLQTLIPADLVSELRASRATLEEKLDEPITTIAYPVGKSISSFPAVRRALIGAGYELGFTTTAGLNPLRADEDMFDLRRISVDRAQPASWNRLRFAIPTLH